MPGLTEAASVLDRVLAVLVGGGLGGFLFSLIQKTLEERSAKRLETTKHDLQLDRERKGVIFEHQRDSLRNVLLAMHEAIREIESNVDAPGDWRPIPIGPVDKFRSTVSQECLFLDDGSEHALDLFDTVMLKAVYDPSFDLFGDDKDAWHSYKQMQLIADRVARHFRSRLGLSSDSQDHLQDVDLLEACRLIGDYRFADFKIADDSPLKFRKGQSASQIVAAARENQDLLGSELRRLKVAAKADDRGGSFFFEIIAEIDRCLARLEQIKHP
jgi:hypothetical protein